MRLVKEEGEKEERCRKKKRREGKGRSDRKREKSNNCTERAVKKRKECERRE